MMTVKDFTMMSVIGVILGLVTPPIIPQESKSVTSPAQVEEKKPSELQMMKAQLIKMQLEFLELQKSFATCQQQTVAGAARIHEAEILKTLDAKPGQRFDWNTMMVTPISPDPSSPVENNVAPKKQ